MGILVSSLPCKGLRSYQSHSCCSLTKLCPTLCDPVDCSGPAYMSFTNSQSLCKFMSTESVMPSNHLVLYHSLLLLSIFPSIRVFPSKLDLQIRWPKYWSLGFSFSPFNEHLDLTSFRIDWFDLVV